MFQLASAPHASTTAPSPALQPAPARWARLIEEAAEAWHEFIESTRGESVQRNQLGQSQHLSTHTLRDIGHTN